MKIAVFATCPKNVYSGGRYHAMMAAQVLARRGHEAFFVTNNYPVFTEDLTPISPENLVKVIQTDNFFFNAAHDLDAVFIAPQMGQLPILYKSAIDAASLSQAPLFLINYETPNWFNALSPVKRPEENWAEWVKTVRQGAIVLCSAHESEKFAKEYYVDVPPESGFAVWQPAINSIACQAVPGQKRGKLVVLYARPSDAHKGSGDISGLLGPELASYRIACIIGNEKQSEEFLAKLRALGTPYNISIEPYFRISDRQKFTLLKQAAALVFPSYFEGYGYPPMEALACDTPCMAYDLPVLREKCGDLLHYVPAGDVGALKRQLIAVLKAARPLSSARLPHIQALTDVDQRGQALEEIIMTFKKRREPQRPTMAAAVTAGSTNAHSQPCRLNLLAASKGLRKRAKKLFKRAKKMMIEKLWMEKAPATALKWAVGQCEYDHKQNIILKGWALVSGNYEVRVFDDQGSLLGVTRSGRPRPDLSKKFQVPRNNTFGFEYCGYYPEFQGEELLVKIIKKSKIMVEKICLLARLNQFKVTDSLYQHRHATLWMQGELKSHKVKLSKLTIFYNEKQIAEAHIKHKFTQNDVHLFNWKFEAFILDNYWQNPTVNFRVLYEDGTVNIYSHTLENNKAVKSDHSHYSNKLMSYVKHGIAISNNIELMPYHNRQVLLIMHNLHATERPEKRIALQALRAELNKRKAELILLHHAPVFSGCSIPEINFFDKDIYEQSSTENMLISADQAEYAARMLYGFMQSINRTAKPMSAIQEQIQEEQAKISAVVRQVKPTLILLWHQWNSLTAIGRGLAEQAGIPIAFLHEGLLPGTLTIDAQGMMAEAEYVGAMLPADDPSAPELLAWAEYCLREIREKHLDRKPQKGSLIVGNMLAEYKKKGIKTVFYAGINDWQSGGLPHDHPRAKLHSPHYVDTAHGLRALLESADRMGFMVLFKPHPNLFPHPCGLEHEKLICVHEADATDCVLATDLTATLLSSLAYISLAHDVPTVLMGRNPLSGTGAAFELSSPDKLDECLGQAFQKAGYPERRQNFKRHLGALLKEHLFPYGGLTNFATLTYRDAADKLFSIMTKN